MLIMMLCSSNLKTSSWFCECVSTVLNNEVVVYLVVKGIVMEERDPKILVIALDFLSRALLKLEYLEVVVNCILYEAACPAALTCNLLHINIQLYGVIMAQKTYHSNHRH